MIPEFGYLCPAIYAVILCFFHFGGGTTSAVTFVAGWWAVDSVTSSVADKSVKDGGLPHWTMRGGIKAFTKRSRRQDITCQMLLSSRSFFSNCSTSIAWRTLRRGFSRRTCTAYFTFFSCVALFFAMLAISFDWSCNRFEYEREMKIAYVTWNLIWFRNAECALGSLWRNFCNQDDVGQHGPHRLKWPQGQPLQSDTIIWVGGFRSNAH